MKYKLLEKEITKKGVDYSQYWRSPDFAVYEARKNNVLIGYEVFKIIKHNGYEIGGNKVVPAETYPGDKTFGSTAFFCVNLDRVKKRLNEWGCRDFNKKKCNLLKQ